MQNNRIVLTIILTALLVGVKVSFVFGNTINPNCPAEVRQAIQNWDSGLDERDAQNQRLSNVATQEHSNVSAQCPQTTSLRPYVPTSLRSLFLSSLIILTFNTPIHSQIQVVKSIQKLFTVAKHYLRIPDFGFRISDLSVIFIILKRFFEKIFFFLIGLILPIFVILHSTFRIPHFTAVPIYYKFHNLRL